LPELLEKQKAQIKFFLLFFGLIICCICIYYIYKSFQWQEIWTLLKQANPILFFFGSTVSLTLYWLTRCLRWYVLLKEENKTVPFRRLYLYTVITLSFSTITPFRTGEALKVELLRKHNAARPSGYTNFAIERLLDLIAVVGFALFGLSGELYNRLAAYIYLVGLVLVLFCLLSLLAVFLLPINVFDKIRGIIKERIKFDVLAKVIFLTFISWVLTAWGWHLSLQSIGIYLDFHQIALLLSLTTLAGILSFVPGSVGVSEISISQILIQIGYQTNLAQSGALIIRGYALMIILLGLAHLFFLKFVLKKNSEF
jgi:glycosyltransferase 2 family protein